MPKEAAAAVAARQAAVDLCQRCAGDTASDLKAEDLWFPLLQVPRCLRPPRPRRPRPFLVPLQQRGDAAVPDKFAAWFGMPDEQSFLTRFQFAACSATSGSCRSFATSSGNCRRSRSRPQQGPAVLPRAYCGCAALISLPAPWRSPAQVPATALRKNSHPAECRSLKRLALL